MDEGDLGNISSDFHLARAIASARDGASPAGDSRYVCEDCGSPIPDRRRAAVPGCVCCFECQVEREK